MSITSQTLFYHILSSAGFKSETACKKDYKLRLAEKNKLDEQSKNREYYANYFRLNATSPDHLRRLLEEKAKEFYNIDLKFSVWKFSYGWTGNSHSAPIGEKTNWERDKSLPTHHLGFSGSVEGTCVFPKDFPSHKNSGLSHFSGFGDFARIIKGFHLQSGSGGQDFHIGANFFINDYPLIAAQHESFLAYRENYREEDREYQNEVYKNNLLQNKLFAEHPVAFEIQGKIAKLKEQISELYKEYFAICDQIKTANPVNFQRKYPIDGCKEAEIFEKLSRY